MSFDAHTHLDFPVFSTERDGVVNRARAAGVTGWAIAATEPKYWDRVLRVAAETGGTPLLGIHPWWADAFSLDDLDKQLQSLAVKCPAHGLGEIGLDYVRAKTQAMRDHQAEVFRRQLALARALKRPVALHCVRAHSDMLHILKTDGLPVAGGLMHGWTGGPQFIAPALDLGLLISFGPSLLNPSRKKVRQSALRVPVGQLCIETDSPDQPLPGRSAGEPADLVDVVEGLAALRNETKEDLWKACGDNARRLWRVERPVD